MDAPSSADIQRYIRFAFTLVSGALISAGFGTSATWTPYAGMAVGVGTFLWSLYGNRLMAKINELAATGQVAAIVVHDPLVADAAPSSLVTSTVDTTVTKKP